MITNPNNNWVSMLRSSTFSNMELRCHSVNKAAKFYNHQPSLLPNHTVNHRQQPSQWRNNATQVSSLTDLDNDHLISEHSCSSNVVFEHRTLVPVTCYLHFLLFLENHNTTNKWPTSRALTMAVSTHINNSWRTDTLWQKINHIKASVWDRNQLKTWKSQDITHQPDSPGILMPYAGIT